MAAIKKTPSKKKQSGSKAKKNILAIDIDRDRLKDISARLRAQGFRVSSCSTSRGVLGRIRREMPDAVIAEVILPVMSGFEIGARMQADPRLSRIPIIFTTDIQDSDGESRDCFPRPLDMPSLVKALKARISEVS
jgi:PleD family two-component response regulator